jgi:vacuolar-type H+-ATPase subunit F/Vma7
MGRLMVITTPDLAPGFQLAGVETFAVESTKRAEVVLRKLMTGDEASLIVIHRGFLHAMDPRLQRQIEISYRPVVVDVPGGLSATPGEGHRRHIIELIRRAIGFHITFGTEQSQTDSR